MKKEFVAYSPDTGGAREGMTLQDILTPPSCDLQYLKELAAQGKIKMMRSSTGILFTYDSRQPSTLRPQRVSSIAFSPLDMDTQMAMPTLIKCKTIGQLNDAEKERGLEQKAQDITFITGKSYSHSMQVNYQPGIFSSKTGVNIVTTIVTENAALVAEISPPKVAS